MNGWTTSVLKTAISTCTDLSGEITECTAFTLRTEEEYSQCTIEPEIDEDVIGPMTKFPGCNLISGTSDFVGHGACDADGNEVGSSTASGASTTKTKTSGAFSTLTSAAAAAATSAVDAASSIIDGIGAESVDTNTDPYLVIVTVTEYVQEATLVTSTITEGTTLTTVTAPAVTTTVEAKVKRHMHEHARRHH
jgi:hypothetical protein